MREGKIFGKMAFEKSKCLPSFVIPTVQNFAKFQKSFIQKRKKLQKLTGGTGSCRPAAENAIPCVEIEQHRWQKCQKSGGVKVSHSLVKKCPKWG